MHGSEHRLDPRRPKPLEPKDVVQNAVETAQVQFLQLNPQMAARLAEHRQSEAAGPRPEKPDQRVTRGAGIAGGVLGVLSALTGNDGLLAFGTGAAGQAGAQLQHAMSQYNAEVDGFEDGLRRLAELETRNQHVLMQQQAREVAAIEGEGRAQKAKMEASKFESDLILERTRTLDREKRGLPPTFQEETNRINAETAQGRLRQDAVKSPEREAADKETAAALKKLSDLKDRRAVALLAGDDPTKIDAEITVATARATSHAVQERVSAVLPGVDAIDPEFSDLSQALVAYRRGILDGRLYLVMLTNALRLGVISEEDYEAAVEEVETGDQPEQSAPPVQSEAPFEIPPLIEPAAPDATITPIRSATYRP